MRDLSFVEIIRKNRQLGKSLSEQEIYDISILSNIIINPFKEILEYSLRKKGINANVSIGDYDNIIQEALGCKAARAVIVFWEICNIFDGIYYLLENMDDSEFLKLKEKLKVDINFLISNLESQSLVLINKFSSLSFSDNNPSFDKMQNLAVELNKHLENVILNNMYIVDIEKPIAGIGFQDSFDFRAYYSSKSLYRVPFYKVYSEYISPFFNAVNGFSKKLIIFDCDNTLWKGVLGEDGIKNIQMSKNTKEGVIFHEIQNVALSLKNKGILLALCSKNNQKDVDQVLSSHPDMLLKDEDFIIKKINWNNKVENIIKIADKLNIGLDSIVFIDDSDFEINFVKEHLPQVHTIQVPVELYKYPRKFRSNISLFYNISSTSEDIKKTELYKEQQKRELVKNKFSTLNDYLKSLDLNITVYKDDLSNVPRFSQLTQKTNQFNLTTKRYTEKEILDFIKSDLYNIFSFSVSDKYGDSGITGLCIIQYKGKKRAKIDSFLMSCRVIGRNIEFVFVDYIISQLKKNKIEIIDATYSPTKKNQQVAKFYKENYFKLLSEVSSNINYRLDINNFIKTKIDYIGIENG